MLVFRLFRVGKNNQPSFKIVVTDKRNPSKGGRFVEQIGFYNPVTKEKVLNKERAQYWISQGVQPSATLHNLFIKDGILEGKKIPVQKKSKKPFDAAQGKPAQGKPAATPAEVKMKEAKPLSSEAPKAAEKPAEKPAEVKLSEAKPQTVSEEAKKEEPAKTEAKVIEAEPQSTEAPKIEESPKAE